jgi:zinc protease
MTELNRATVPEPGTIRPFHLPRVERETLSNGLSLFTAEHGIVPLTTASIVLDAGATREPQELAGIAHLVANTIDAGTGSRDAEQLSWDLELLGAHLEATTGWDAQALTITAPADQFTAALAILGELVTDARFPDEEVIRVQTEQVGEILQNRSEPRMLASEMFARFVYGPTGTYGRSVLGDTSTVERLAPSDVRSFYQSRFAPAESALLLVGTINEQILDAARSCLREWRSKAAPAITASTPDPTSGASIHIVHRPGSVQSEIRVGHIGVSRADPEYFPLTIMNSILGGAFTSRLNMNLREKQGFTYGVRSAFAFRRAPGPFSISTAVATDVTARAVEEILREVDSLRRDGATSEEVANTRDYLAGLVPLEWQTTHQVAGKLSEVFVYALPDEYFATYRDRIAGVSEADVLRVAQTHVRPEQFSIVIVGDADQIEQPLHALGVAPVTVHSIDE